MVSKLFRNKLNLFFTLVYFLIALFIVVATVTVMVRGLPHILHSLKLDTVQFAIKLSLITSLISTTICIFIAIPVAYAMARLNLPLKSILNTIIDLPLALPPIVSGVCLLLFFGTTPFGKWLGNHGISFIFTKEGIILAQIFINLPFMTRVLKSTIIGVDSRLEFVARTLGCSPLQAFLKVTLPLSKNGIIAGTVITWSRALGEFGAALMLAGATRFATETLPIALFLNMSTGDLEAAMAVANILIIISTISLFIFNKHGGEFVGSTRIG